MENIEVIRFYESRLQESMSLQTNLMVLRANFGRPSWYQFKRQSMYEFLQMKYDELVQLRIMYLTNLIAHVTNGKLVEIPYEVTNNINLVKLIAENFFESTNATSAIEPK